MPLGHTQITGNMTVREAFLNVLNEDIGELFSRVETLERGGLSGVAIATEEEAIQGQNNTKMMTPLRTRQAIAYNLPIATEEEAVQGQNNTKMMTPLRVRQSIVSNPEDYLKTSLHTKSLHDSLLINADTVDGRHASDFRLASDHVVLQSGKVVDFADETGDKIRLYGTTYGLGIGSSELTLYTPSSAEVSLRQGAYDGTKLGDLIHTGNMLNKGVSMPLARYTSSSGGIPVVVLHPTTTISFSTSYYHIANMTIPWSGTTNYAVGVSNPDSSEKSVYIKIEATEYGPYTIPANSSSDIGINYTASSACNIGIQIKTTSGSASFFKLQVRTGNSDCMYKVSFWALNVGSGYKIT